MPSSTLRRTLGQLKTARLALKMRSADADIRELARTRILERLTNMNGLAAKAAQIMFMNNDGRSENRGHEHQPPSTFALNQELYEAVLAERLGRKLSDSFAYISAEPILASIAQVQRAQLKSGEEVAIKLAYPGIKTAIGQDLRLLGLVAKTKTAVTPALDFSCYREEFTRSFEAELDFNQERETQKKYARAFDSDPQICVPRVYEELCRNEVIVTAWCGGSTLEEAAKWPLAAREQAADIMVRHLLESVFERGIVHGDLHPGNFRFRRAQSQQPAQLVLYDFGSTLKLEAADRLNLLRLIDSIPSRTNETFELLLALGFREDLLQPIRRELPEICKILFEPFASESHFELANWNRKERIDAIIGDRRWNLRMAGPPSWLKLLRAFHGLIHALTRLGVAPAWGSHFQAIRSRIDVKSAKDETSAVTRLNQAESSCSRLRIQIAVDGIDQVKLAFPADAIGRLDSLLDPSTLEKIRQRGIDLIALAERSRANDFSPRMLFELKETKREIRVWLE